ncbi:MAG: hypothetical protein LUC93_03765 [Planctomycetaceae bacterium]|nr:hypothetical protein [Planctomycetaceae bacterium]
MSKTMKMSFVIINIVYFVFNYFIVPYLPNPLVFGFMPFQLFCYLACAPIAALVWGLYFTMFFRTQHAYFNED